MVAMQAVDGLDGIAVAEKGGFEEILVALLDGGGIDLFRETTVIAKARGDTEDEESLGVIVQQALLVIIHDGVPVLEQRGTHRYGVAVLRLRRGMDTALIARPNDRARKKDYKQIQKQTTRTKMRTACTVTRLIRTP